MYNFPTSIYTHLAKLVINKYSIRTKLPLVYSLCPAYCNSQPTIHKLYSLLKQYRIAFPRFNGKGFQDWWYQVDQYFSSDEVPHHQKVRVASMYLEDLTLQWHKAYMRSRAHPQLPPPSWEEYIGDFSNRFGAEFTDPMSELVKVK